MATFRSPFRSSPRSIFRGVFAGPGAIPASWTPAEITTRFWASADNGFTDRSGGGNDYTTRKGRSLPDVLSDTLNGLSVWDFDGSTQLIGSDIGIDFRDCHAFFVTRAADTSISLQRDASQADRLYIDGTSTFFGSTDCAPAGVPTSGWVINETIAVGDDKTVTIDGGAQEASVTDTFTTTPLHEVFFLGGGENHLEVLSACQVAEVVSVDPTISTDDRQKIQGYLAHKWGLEGQLPGGHPYKSSPPTV